jgi:sensor domain CHASE-containing protein
MSYWQIFWTIWLVIAGVSFAVITAIVTVKGYEDLRVMFSRLTEQRTEENNE